MGKFEWEKNTSTKKIKGYKVRLSEVDTIF